MVGIAGGRCMSKKPKTYHFEKLKIQRFIQELGENIPAELLEALFLGELIKYREFIDRLKAGWLER